MDAPGLHDTALAMQTIHDSTEAVAEEASDDIALDEAHCPSTAEDVATIIGKLGTRAIVLVGMPGSGKSAIGKRLARRLALPFTDADAEIETAARMTIADIFATQGEPYFREGEARVIARILKGGAQVVATGGGAYMNAETRQRIADHGLSVWLKVDLDVLMRRVRKRPTRPLLQTPDPEGRMRDLMEARHPIYASADLTVFTEDLPHEQSVRLVIEALARHLEKASSR
jgi:shikimate kinase